MHREVEAKDMKQIVGHKKISSLGGFLIVLALVAILVFINYFVLSCIAGWIGYTAASVGFWIIGILLALYVLRVYVVRYSYEIDGGVLRLNRSYGKRKRFIEDIYLRQILFTGTKDAAKKRYPSVKTVRALYCRSDIAPLAVVYKNSEGIKCALIQANDEIRICLENAVKENRK